MKRSNVTPPTDLTNSREYYGMYNSRDFYRGTSFKMSGEWSPNTHYFNDEYIIDFVSYQGALLSCTRSHISSSNGGDVPQLVFDGDRIIGIKANPFWAFVMSGTEGPEGPEGKVWIPTVSDDGIISWKQSNESPNTITPVNIKGVKGDTPVMDVVQQDGNYYWTVDGELVKDPITNKPIPVQGPTGKVWTPVVSNGILSWTESEEPIEDTPIINLKGDKGDTPIMSVKKDSSDDTYYWIVTVNGKSEWVVDEQGHQVKAQGPQGEKGDQGDPGEKGDTPKLRINTSTNLWEVSYKEDEWNPLQVKATPSFSIKGSDLGYNYGDGWKSIGKVVGENGKSPVAEKYTDGIYYWKLDGSWLLGSNGEKIKAQGVDGFTPKLSIKNDTWWIIDKEGGEPRELGRAIGDQGIPGRTPKLKREFGNPDTLYDDRILWGYDGVDVSEWTTLCYLHDLRGDSIDSVNITDAEGHLELTMESKRVITSTGSVLPKFNAGTIETVEWDQNPTLAIDKTNAPREWALNIKVPKGKPATVTVIPEVEKLSPDAQPYVTDLNPDNSSANLKFGIPQGEKGDPGDENIAIGCQSDFPNNEPEHDKIWYDPCDESMDEYSVQDFLYHSYIAVGGTLTQEQFETAWKSFPNTAGFEIRFANSFEELGDPTVDKLGKLYMIPATSAVLHDLFEEYIVVHSPSTTEDVYMWEKWGSGQITVDLKNYYTKSEVDQQIQKLEDKIEEVSSTIWNEV